MDAALALDAEQYEAMLAHARAMLPEEACGILAGRDGQVTRVIPVENCLHSPVRYRMDAQAQLNAFLWMEDNGQDLLAIFHSHPAGPPRPSPTDVAEFAYPGALTVICAPAGGHWQARAFTIEGEAVREAELRVGA